MIIAAWGSKGLKQVVVMVRVRTVGSQSTLLLLRELCQFPFKFAALNHRPVLYLEFIAVTLHGIKYFIFVDNHRLDVIFLFNINNLDVTGGSYRFFHYILITMMGYKLFLSLNVSKGKATDLGAFAVGCYRMPLNTLEFQKEVHNVDRVNEVDESIADIALSL